MGPSGAWFCDRGVGGMQHGRPALPSSPDRFRVRTTDRYPQWVRTSLVPDPKPEAATAGETRPPEPRRERAEAAANTMCREARREARLTWPRESPVSRSVTERVALALDRTAEAAPEDRPADATAREVSTPNEHDRRA